MASARIARAAADAFEAREPGRPRYVAGAIGPTNRTASISPGRQRPRRPKRPLRRAGRGVSRGGPRPGRGRRRHPAGRDDLRHAQRQGRHLRDRRALRRARLPAAADDLRDDHRRQRADAERPDRRGVLELRPPRPAVQHGLQLRPRSAAAAALHPGAGADRGRAGQLPTRTPACPTSSAATTRSPRKPPASFAASRPTGSSTSWAAAAGPRPPTSGPSPRPSAGLRPRIVPKIEPRTRLSGLEPLTIPQPGNLFVNVGERTNITGSRAFARLVLDGRFDAAVEIARSQVRTAPSSST